VDKYLNSAIVAAIRLPLFCAFSFATKNSTMASKKSHRLSELAAQISQKAAYLEKYLDDHNLPQPSFGADGPATFPVPPDQAEATNT
jgi:hypothetical protein